MTVNQWIDNNLKLMHGRKLRLISFVTHENIGGDNYLPYFNHLVLDTKVTSRFIFLFI